MRLALAYQTQANEQCSSSSGGVTNIMRACAAASISRRCLAASIAHYSCFTSRTASASDGRSTSPIEANAAVSDNRIAGSLPAALATACGILVQSMPQGQCGEVYVLPSGAGLTAFEEQWLGGGAAAEAALQKVNAIV